MVQSELMSNIIAQILTVFFSENSNSNNVGNSLGYYSFKRMTQLLSICKITNQNINIGTSKFNLNRFVLFL